MRSATTEDYLLFESRPERAEIEYRVDVAAVAGLRLVADSLEFLDGEGTPRLRVAPPYVIDARNERHPAKLSVEDCAYDTRPRAPWGRPVVEPGASACTVRVSWAGLPVEYPALVDPAWTTRGSMSVARYGHTADRLASGRILVVGGSSSGPGYFSSAELFDPATSTFG